MHLRLFSCAALLFGILSAYSQDGLITPCVWVNNDSEEGGQELNGHSLSTISALDVGLIVDSIASINQDLTLFIVTSSPAADEWLVQSSALGAFYLGAQDLYQSHTVPMQLPDVIEEFRITEYRGRILSNYDPEIEQSEVLAAEGIELPISLDFSPMENKHFELLTYHQGLTDRLMAKTRTYLAIKYGIPIHERNYLSPQDSILWSVQDDSQYKYHVFGLGRNSEFGLNQTKARSSESGLLEIEVQDGNIENDEYLIVGQYNQENSGGILDIVSPDVLEWRIRPHGDGWSSELVDLSFDVPGYIPFLSTVSLVVSSDGEQFSEGFVYESDEFTDGRIYFRDILFDSDLSGSDLMRLEVALFKTIEDDESSDENCPLNILPLGESNKSFLITSKDKKVNSCRYLVHSLDGRVLQDFNIQVAPQAQVSVPTIPNGYILTVLAPTCIVTKKIIVR